MKRAIASIEEELGERLAYFKRRASSWRRSGCEQRTEYDLEMLREVGVCQGIENYSRHLTGRAPGEPPATLLDYFPRDFLMIIDESHQTIPQIGAMYRRRPLPQGDAGGVRVPAAFGPGQPAADV